MERAEYLEPKIPEAMLVSRLIKHFGDTFYECANLRCIETVEEFVKLIQRFETKGMWNKSSKDYGQLGTKSNTGAWGFKPSQGNLNGNWRDRSDGKKSPKGWTKNQGSTNWKDKNNQGKNNRSDNQKKGQIRVLITDEDTESEQEEATTTSSTSETSENSLGLEE